ncbi:MAG: DASS family sodium-coupled anion symporter, partial [Planctomycetota bacterium]|nr:DASS family sodium-coupled anion symporter [Planctomycetota bacterium]
RRALAVTVLTVSAWLLQAMPLAPASLIPLALFPLCGVQSMAMVAPSYAHPILWLFFGGFIIALAIEKCGLHRRIALRVISFIGLRPRRLVLGFLMSGLLLSMWISNTATTLMLLPIGGALIDRVKREGIMSGEAADRLAVVLMLGIAYGCSVGGTASPIGTFPNLLYLQEYSKFEGAPAFSFFSWMLAFAPFAIFFGLVIWALLVYVIHRLPAGSAEAGASIKAEAASMAPMASSERRVLCLFLAAVVLWITRGDMEFGDGLVIQGWVSRMGLPHKFVTDGSVAVTLAILAFLIPGGGRGSERLMDWETARRLPWEILFLLAGGVAIAAAFRETGLGVAIGAATAPLLEGVSPLLAVIGVTLFITFLTEVTSNTAITAIMLPILAATASGAGLDPRVLMLPATIAASCAFMFPIATPPNAIVYSSNRVSMRQMGRTGFFLNLTSVLVVIMVFWIWVFPLLGVDPGIVPEWAKR